MVRFPWEYEWSSAREHVGFIEEAGIRSEDEGNESEHRTPGLVSDRSITQSSSFHGAGKVSEKDTSPTRTSRSSSRIIKLSPLQELDLNWNPEGWREFLGFPDELGVFRDRLHYLHPCNIVLCSIGTGPP